MAVIYAGLGDEEQTFAWLNRAYDERDSLLALYLTTDSRLDGFTPTPALLISGRASDLRLSPFEDKAIQNNGRLVDSG